MHDVPILNTRSYKSICTYLTVQKPQCHVGQFCKTLILILELCKLNIYSFCLKLDEKLYFGAPVFYRDSGKRMKTRDYLVESRPSGNPTLTSSA